MKGARSELIELVDEEQVVERGTTRVVWFVRNADAWLSASEVPGAVVEKLDAGPGTIWRTRIELSVANGTALMRVESRPAPPEHHEPLVYLAREIRGAKRQAIRTYYRVAARGQLKREKSPGPRAIKRI